MTVSVNGVELYVEKSGQGPPLIMVHGNGEDHGIFREAVSVLGTCYTCYCPDSRGHGASTPVTELHYEDMARDAVCLMEALDLRDVTFVGFSDGGIVGLMAAARCDRIKTLVVCGANLTPGGIKGRFRFLFQALYLVKKDPKTALMLREPDLSEKELGRIRARTLVLAGSGDVIREAETRRIAAAVPGAELRILKGESHSSYVAGSEKIAWLVLAFAEKNSPGNDPRGIWEEKE